MLTQDDLNAIGQLIDEKAVKPLQALDVKIDGLRTEMNTKFDGMQERFDGLQAEMDTKFDAVQERFDEIENKMITAHDLERRETDLAGRLDKRYVRQRT